MNPYAGVDAVDLFAGPGGWSVAARDLGLVEIGVENDPNAVATRLAAGHRTIATGVERLDPRMFRGVPGLIASPPCQTFSAAGKGSGRRQLDLVVRAVKRMGLGEWPAEEIEETHDERTALVLQPLRWALLMGPEWIAFEQVPTVLPVWQAMGEVLEGAGYHVVTGLVHAEQYGVPQTRKRAALMAHRTRRVSLPTPTHSRYYPRNPTKRDPDVLSWVSIADALGPEWADRVIRSNYGTGGDPANRGERAADEPSATVTSKVDRNRVLYTGTRPGATKRREDEPAPTLAFGNDAASHVFVDDDVDPTELPAIKAGSLPRFAGAGRTAVDTAGQIQRESATDPAHTITGKGTAAWVHDRPSTTVVGSFRPDVIAAPGYRTTVSRQNAPGSVRVTVEEAGILQSFPADYPWQGKSGKRYQQVGNAVPPTLARAILSEILDVPFP